MSIITKMLKQSAVYWGPPAEDGNGGYTWPEPIEVLCRWEEKSKAKDDPKSNERVSVSTVYVDRDVEVGGYLLLDASLSNVTGNLFPDSIEGARRIREFDKLPNFRATEFLRTVTL